MPAQEDDSSEKKAKAMRKMTNQDNSKKDET